MSDFDPYLKWLGIRETQRPVNHYRLLGLELFEADSDVISTAADRQMAHVRTYQNGARAELSQKILNELAVARRCLLMPEQKKAYDQELQQAIEPKSPPTAKPATPPIPIVTAATPKAPAAALKNSPVAVHADANMRKKRQKRENKQMTMSIIGWIGGGLAAIAFGAYLINSGLLPGFDKKDKPVEDRDVQIVDKDPNNSSKPNKSSGSRKVDKDTPKVVNNNRSQAGNPTKQNDPPKIVKDDTPKVVPDPAVDDPNHPDFKWNRFNLQRYPDISNETKKLLADIGKSVTDKTLHQFEASNTKGGDSNYRLIDDELLVGLALSPYADGTIRTIAPLKLGGQGLRIGAEYGKKYNNRTFLVAKPGYAVGAVEVSTEHPMKCIRLVYMKILSDRLDTQNQYTSEWYPKKIRPVTRIRNSVGVPIVGTYGRFLRQSNISTLGLIGALTSDEHKVAIKPNTGETNTMNPDNGSTTTFVDPPKVAAKPDAPTPAELTAARNELLLLYERQIRRAKPDERALKSSNENVRNMEMTRARTRARDLANLISNDAQAESAQPAIQFAMFREVASMGTQIGDLEIVLDSMRELRARYQFEYWKPMKNVIQETAANSAASEAFMFRQNLDELIDEAIGEGELKMADWMVNWALDQVRKTDRTQAEKYRDLDRKVSGLLKVQVANERGLKVLDTRPDDPEANENVGLYEFLVKEDVELALGYWAKSNDERLLKLVKLSKETDFENSANLLSLAEAWRECGQANRTFKDKRFLEQARELITRAVRLVDGLEKRRIERMANELSAEIDE